MACTHCLCAELGLFGLCSKLLGTGARSWCFELVFGLGFICQEKNSKAFKIINRTKQSSGHPITFHMTTLTPFYPEL